MQADKRKDGITTNNQKRLLERFQKRIKDKSSEKLIRRARSRLELWPEASELEWLNYGNLEAEQPLIVKTAIRNS